MKWASKANLKPQPQKGRFIFCSFTINYYNLFKTELNNYCLFVSWPIFQLKELNEYFSLWSDVRTGFLVNWMDGGSKSTHGQGTEIVERRRKWPEQGHR